jgi:hypothetical protein
MAVHGIDAWHDEEAGRAEARQLTSVTGQKRVGVRMHWLYFGCDSPRCIEAAGFDYDSTCGYNEAVGYRAGTSQVFRLAGSDGLLELPLSIMDTSLLSRGRMALDSPKALEKCRPLIKNAKRFGGTVVINWHCRSVAPERLWGGVYGDLLREIEAGDRVWVATAQEAVDWFRWRRSIKFVERSCGNSTSLGISTPHSHSVAATIRVCKHAKGETVVEDRMFRWAMRDDVTLLLEEAPTAG